MEYELTFGETRTEKEIRQLVIERVRLAVYVSLSSAYSRGCVTLA